MPLRRALSVLLALVFALQGGLALAVPGCVHADAVATADTADGGAAHAGHEDHAGATHDHGAMATAGEGGALAAHPCAEDCRCAGLCAATPPCAIVVDVHASASTGPADRPDAARPAAHSALPPQRLLRPPIIA